MFMNFVLLSVATLLFSSLTTINALVLKRDVIVPPVLYPTTGTQWVVGQKHNVTWDLSVVPNGFTGTGMIVLGFIDGSDDGSEHLDLDHPLANGFLISAGRTEITVPAVPDRSDYIVVLFGDSGNASGKFTIKNIGISSPSPSSTVTSPTSSTVVTGSTSATSISGSGSDSTTTTSTNSTEDTSAPAVESTGDVATPDSTTGTPLTPLPTGLSASSSGLAADSTPSPTTTLTQLSASASTTAPVITQSVSNNGTATQNNAGSLSGSISFAMVFTWTICTILARYFAL